MLKVLPIQNKTDQELDCARCGIPFRPDALAYRAPVDDMFVGLCQFKLTDKGGIIYDIAPTTDFYSFDALFTFVVINNNNVCAMFF